MHRAGLLGHLLYQEARRAILLPISVLSIARTDDSLSVQFLLLEHALLPRLLSLSQLGFESDRVTSYAGRRP